MVAMEGEQEGTGATSEQRLEEWLLFLLQEMMSGLTRRRAHKSICEGSVYVTLSL